MKSRSARIQLVVILALFCFSGLACSSPKATSQRGHLVIIGGGERADYMMQRIVDLAGGAEARFLIVPNASSDPIGTAEYQKEQLESYGVSSVDYVNLTSETVDDDTSLANLDGITGIFFSGGDQSRLQAVLNGTEFLRRIHSIYDNGGLISGTSAGAAVMSELMITGNELVSQDSIHPFGFVQEGNIEALEGFGLVTKAIIDQHFVRRKRLNRLITLILENPHLVGVGIDESTAIVVYPDDTFEVLGEYTVMVFDPSRAKNIAADGNGNLSASGVALHILQAGQRYDLKSRRILH
ncbi:cyanophycinase [Candidatus Neomarinimicrobiota bacterium]